MPTEPQTDTLFRRIGAFFRATVSAFDLKANLAKEDDFFELPYPLDWRRDAQGHPELQGYPVFDTSAVMKALREVAGEAAGFPTLARGYFRFNRPLKSRNTKDVIPARPDSPILLIDVDPRSPDRGQLYPTIAATPAPGLGYVPAFLLTVGAASGVVLHPNRQYAFVVQRSQRDIFGGKVAAPKVLKRLLSNSAPSDSQETQLYNIYQPLRNTLPKVGLAPSDIAAATVFTTGDPVGEMARLSQQVVDRYSPTVENLRLAPAESDRRGGADHERFWELHGTVSLPQFQTGEPPFNRGGRFVFRNGDLVEQRTEVVPVVITIPKNKPMPPEGFPLMLYQHGSNGLSTQVVDRGPILEVDGEPQPGLGPAHVVADIGVAAVGSAAPVNPERLPGAKRDAYLNFQNLAAYRETFRQGAIDLRLLIKALENLSIPTSLLPGSSAGEAFRINTDPAAILGQSLGSQFAHMLGAIEPKIKAVIPTGAPGFWSLLVPETELSGLVGAYIGTAYRLDPLHPGLNLIQAAWEAADPITYSPYIAQRPLPGHPARSIYMPAGQGDSQVPEPIFDALALADGLKQVDFVIWPEMQESLALGGLEGRQRYPAAHNLRSEDGQPYTGVVMQYRGDRIADPHTIVSQLEAVKFQYSYFLKTLFAGEPPTVKPPPITSEPIA